jgi:phage repressor protein C with HTH and peptisase S24 domain
MDPILIDEMVRRMKAAGYNQRSLARAAGLNDTYIRDIIKGKSPSPRSEDLGKVAAALGCSITSLLPTPDLLRRQPTADESKTSGFLVNRASATADVPAMQQPFRTSPDIDPLPVYGSGFCGADGRFDMNGQVVDWVARPERLRGIPGAYAVYVAGTSMEPRYMAGEVLYVHPGKPVTPGCFVVVQLQPEHEGDLPQAFVKQLVKMDSDRVVLREFSPEPRKFEVARDAVLSLHRIVQSGESQ